MSTDFLSYVPFPAFMDWSAPFDSSVVDQYAERLRMAKESTTPQARDFALEVATRSAAVDTGALEGLYTTDRGFTRTIATQSEHWQRALDQRDEQTKRSIDDALAAYDYVLDAVTGSTPVTEKWIRELHAVITEHQETFSAHVLVGGEMRTESRPLPHGEYKTLPNNPTSSSTGRVHHYAAPEDTVAEMGRLVEELRSDAFLHAHPVVQAAYAHYAYVCIHPFVDGNGRVARALASVYLYRNPGVPLVIFADQRDVYLDALEAADEGRPHVFIEFVSERVIDTIGLVIGSLDSGEGAPEGDLSSIVAKTRYWPDDSLRHLAPRLEHLCVDRLKGELGTMALPATLHVGASIGAESMTDESDYVDHRATGVERRMRGTAEIVAKAMTSFASTYGDAPGALYPAGYYRVGAGSRLCIAAVLDPETGRRLLHNYDVLATGRPRSPQFLIQPQGDHGVPLEVWGRDIDPSVTTAFQLRLDAWARKAVRHFLQQLNQLLTESGGVHN